MTVGVSKERVLPLDHLLVAASQINGLHPTVPRQKVPASDAPDLLPPDLVQFMVKQVEKFLSKIESTTEKTKYDLTHFFLQLNDSSYSLEQLQETFRSLDPKISRFLSHSLQLAKEKNSSQLPLRLEEDFIEDPRILLRLVDKNGTLLIEQLIEDPSLASIESKENLKIASPNRLHDTFACSFVKNIQDWIVLTEENEPCLEGFLQVLTNNAYISGEFAKKIKEWAPSMSEHPEVFSRVCQSVTSHRIGRNELGDEILTWTPLLKHSPALLKELFRSIFNPNDEAWISPTERCPKWVLLLKDQRDVLLSFFEVIAGHDDAVELFINSDSFTECMLSLEDSPELLIDVWRILAASDQGVLDLIATSSKWVPSIQNKDLLLKMFDVLIQSFCEKAKPELFRNLVIQVIPLLKKDEKLLFKLFEAVAASSLGAAALGYSVESWIPLIEESKCLKLLDLVIEDVNGLQLLVAKLPALQRLLNAEQFRQLFLLIGQDHVGVEALARRCKVVQELPSAVLEKIWPEWVKSNLDSLEFFNHDYFWLEKISPEGLNAILQEIAKIRADLSIFNRSLLTQYDESVDKLLEQVEFKCEDSEAHYLLNFPFLEEDDFVDEGASLVDRITQDSGFRSALRQRIESGDLAIYAKLSFLWSCDYLSAEEVDDIGLMRRKLSLEELRKVCFYSENPLALLEKLYEENAALGSREDVLSVIKYPEVWCKCVEVLEPHSPLESPLKQVLQAVLSSHDTPLYPFSIGIAFAANETIQADLKNLVGLPLEFSPQNFASYTRLNTEELVKAQVQNLPPLEDGPSHFVQRFENARQALKQINRDFENFGHGVHDLAHYFDTGIQPDWLPSEKQRENLRLILGHTLKRIETLIEVLRTPRSEQLLREEASSEVAKLSMLLEGTINNCEAGKDAAIDHFKWELLNSLGATFDLRTVLKNALSAVKDEFLLKLISAHDSQSVHALAAMKTIFDPYVGYSGEGEPWNRSEKEKEALLIALYLNFRSSKVEYDLRKTLEASAFQEQLGIQLTAGLFKRLQREQEGLERSLLFNLAYLRTCETLQSNAQEDYFRFSYSTKWKSAIEGRREPSEVEQAVIRALERRHLKSVSFADLEENVDPQLLSQLIQFYNQGLSYKSENPFQLYAEIWARAISRGMTFEAALKEREEESWEERALDVFGLFKSIGSRLVI